MPGWGVTLLNIAVALMDQADTILDALKKIPGIDARQVEDVVRADRAERKRLLDQYLASEWPK